MNVSWLRFVAIVIKEFLQMRRDRLTFAMMVGIPLIQLILFGFAINTDPKHLPTVVFAEDDTIFTRRFLQALEISSYFRFLKKQPTIAEAERLLTLGEIQFIIHIPKNFSRALQRGENPALLIETDATDPVATNMVLSHLQILSQTVLDRELDGNLLRLRSKSQPFELRIHRRYNPEGITAFNIVPGLIGVILTMAMVTMTALAVTRERERGTMETLLATPARPIEVIFGKLIPYIMIGYVQVILILLSLHFIFAVPIQGSLALLLAVVLLFIITNLMVGMLLSTFAKNQMQAMQMTFFFFLPSILLSGFMFPFRGMPHWAQAIGELFPLTHFLRLVRGIILKGAGLEVMLVHIWPIIIFLGMVGSLAVLFYRKTLD